MPPVTEPPAGSYEYPGGAVRLVGCTIAVLSVVSVALDFHVPLQPVPPLWLASVALLYSNPSYAKGAAGASTATSPTDATAIIAGSVAPIIERLKNTAISRVRRL